MKKTIPQHSSETVEHFTPEWLVSKARTVLGNIDLDPASCALAQEVVRAEAWYGPGSWIGKDGMDEPWLGRVFLNPPGGRAPAGMTTNSNVVLWWARLTTEFSEKEVEAAIFVGFSLELLRSAQVLEGLQPLDFCCCIPKSRIAFDTIDDEGRRVESSSPTNANILVGLGVPFETFKGAFEDVGLCWPGLQRFGWKLQP